jgi:hypothetical protein
MDSDLGPRLESSPGTQEHSHRLVVRLLVVGIRLAH